MTFILQNFKISKTYFLIILLSSPLLVSPALLGQSINARPGLILSVAAYDL